MNEQPNNGNIILYQMENGKSRIEITFLKKTLFHNSGINICKWYTFAPY